MKNRWVFAVLTTMTIGLVLLGVFVFKPSVSMRRRDVDKFLAAFEQADAYAIELKMEIDRDDRSWTVEDTLHIRLSHQSVFRDTVSVTLNADPNRDYRYIERLGDQWIGYEELPGRYLDPVLLDVTNPDTYLEDSVAERPDTLIESLPWENAKIISATHTRFELTKEAFLDNPLFAEAASLEHIDEDTVLPSKFRAFVDLETSKTDGHLIVTANAFDLSERKRSYECGDSGFSLSDCLHYHAPTSFQSTWHYRLVPDEGVFDLEELRFHVLPPSDPAWIRADSVLDVEYRKPAFVFRPCVQRFWFEAGRYERTLIGDLYVSRLTDENGTDILFTEESFLIPASGWYVFRYQSGDEVRFTFHFVE